RPQGSGIDTSDPDVGLEKQAAAAAPAPIEIISVDLLCEAQGHRAFGVGLAGDEELIIQAGRLAILDSQADDCKHDTGVARERLLRVSQRPQPFGACSLEETQIVRIVDDTAAVGVLPIDASRPGEAAHRGSSNKGRLAVAALSGAFRPKCR